MNADKEELRGNMALDYHTAQGDFSTIVQQLHPWVLSNFVMWLDLKVAEYKVLGKMALGKIILCREH